MTLVLCRTAIWSSFSAGCWQGSWCDLMSWWHFKKPVPNAHMTCVISGHCHIADASAEMIRDTCPLVFGFHRCLHSWRTVLKVSSVAFRLFWANMRLLDYVQGEVFWAGKFIENMYMVQWLSKPIQRRLWMCHLCNNVSHSIAKWGVLSDIAIARIHLTDELNPGSTTVQEDALRKKS